MKPLSPEDRDEGRRLAVLALLRGLLAAAKAQTKFMVWRAKGGPEAIALLDALETGGSDPLLERWRAQRRTVAANHPVPDSIELAARNLVVLLAETLSRTGLGKVEAREQTARAVQRMFRKKAKRHKGRPSTWEAIDADSIRYWQNDYPTPTPDHEKLITEAIDRCGHDHPQIKGWFVKRIELVIDPAAARETLRLAIKR
jgi:hypothetical protein